MKKTITFLSSLLVISVTAFGQNVGIGTTTPAIAYRLHVHNGLANQDASIGITNSLTTDANLRGVRLRMLNSDFHIQNYETTGKINFATNFNTRMTIDATGKVGINTLSPNHALHVTALNKYGIFSTATENGTDTIAGVFGKALSPTPVPYSAGVRGESNSTDFNGIGVLGVHSGSGWGVAGFVKELGGAGYGSGVFGATGFFSPGGNGGYGVHGFNNNVGGAAGYFLDNNGTASSYALKTQGKLEFNGIGEANGKVLTSDASGNATWQNLPGGAGAWSVTGNDIINTNNGIVRIGTPNIVGFDSKLTVAANSTVTNGTLALHENENDYARLQFSNQNSAGNNYWHLAGYNDGGTVANDKFNIYHGVTGDILTVTGNGRVGIGTAAPATANKLHVHDATSFDASIGITNGLTTDGILRGARIRMLNSDLNLVNYETSGSIKLNTGAGPTTRLTIDNVGNIGIGTTPTEKLEINNGFIKVSGTNKTAFTVTATAGNSSGHVLELNYANQASTDILIVTHNYSPPGGPTSYHNYNVGVFWNGSRWTIYNENTLVPILGVSFNVLVIKQ